MQKFVVHREKRCMMHEKSLNMMSHRPPAMEFQFLIQVPTVVLIRLMVI